MKQPKKLFLLGVCVAILAGLVPSSAQAPTEQQTLALLVKEVAEQQAKIVANQTVIDEKVATVTENLRLAKIFVSRGK